MMELAATVEVDNRVSECNSITTGKKRSIAWDHFEKNKDEGKARCRHCDMVLAATPRSGTSHLKRHVERCPKRVILDVKPISMEPGSGEIDHSIDVDSMMTKRKTSMVWNEFERLRAEDLDQPKAQCKHCHLILSAAAKNGTSHLKRHLNKCPKRAVVAIDVSAYPLPTGQVKFVGGSSLSQSEIDPNDLLRYLTSFIIEGAHPFTLVEERGFRLMMSKACPLFKPISSSTVKKELFSMYVKERDNVKEMLANAPGRICLTIHSWKTRDTGDEYVFISAQFIDDHWKLHRRVLCLRAAAPTYGGISFNDDVAYSLSQWSIENKIFSVTVDDSSPDESIASSLLSDLLSKRVLLPIGSLPKIHCFSHVLTLIAVSSLKLIDDVLGKARDSVRNINRSSIQRKKFFDLANKKFHLPARKKLQLDTPSNWNSTYKFLGHVLYYKDVFLHLEGWDHHLRSEEEWQKLSMVHKFLKSLYDVTCMISDATCSTVNVYLKALLMVHCRMLEIVRGPHCFLTNTIREMQRKLDHYWSENSLILSCAAILDPKFKIKFVEYCYMKLYGSSDVGVHVSKVVNALYCLFAEYKHRTAQKSSLLAGSSSCHANFAGEGDDGDVFGDYDQFLSVTSRSQGNKSELELYLEEPSYDLNCDLDVLEFWSNSAMRYPELSVVARDILSIPVSTVTSHFDFNIGAKTFSGIDSSMMPDTVQALICLQDWLVASHDTDEPTIASDDPSGSSDDAGCDDDDDDSELIDSF
ncbi:Zinc finger BED domain-containing protein [Drosera capensis]